MKGLTKYLITPIVSMALTGCSHYEVLLNDNLVYTPPPLFTDYLLVDAALRGCIGQTIKDQNITEAEGLKNLNCSYAVSYTHLTLPTTPYV